MPRIINDRRQIEVRRDLRKNQTKEEILLWSKLRNSQTGYKWKRQVSIGSYIADFYCREKLLVIELDGSQHLGNKEYDKERDEFFKFLGIKTLRFWNNEFSKNVGGAMNKILFALDRTLSQPHLSPLLKGEDETPSPFQEKG
jgi:very-short-patch-repair endonuclease